MGRWSDILLRRFAAREEDVELAVVNRIQRCKSISSVKEVKRITRRQCSDPFPLGELPDSRAVNTVKCMQRANAENAFSEFFPENTCQKRAVFMLVLIKKQAVAFLSKDYPAAIEPLLSTIGSRLFTLFYIIQVLPDGPERAVFMEEANELIKQAQLPPQVCGVREAAYAVSFSLHYHQKQYGYTNEELHIVLNKALKCIQSCIERELKLSTKERESMYVFQQVIANTSYPTPSY
ncbi:hypothetical protein L0F63_005487 [Massospora cicadina]|nr:hypothetical protein L0F63_005487 [Massospora cicadina]